MTMINEKFQALEAALNTEVLERMEENHTAVLALLAKKHHFQIGPPGTAKSWLVNRIAIRIDGLPKDGYFHWLLTRHTTPDELYGVPNLPDLKRGVYRRNVEGKLPRAHIVFLDEIFKGNSSILNANLTAMNERIFHNGPEDDPNIPLMTLYAASNEMPQGEELGALWDRLHFRHEIRPLHESSNFMRMLTATVEKQPEKLVSLQDIFQAHEEISRITVPMDVFETLKQLREDLMKVGVEATERRWNDCVPIVKAEAWVQGRESVDIDDLRPLMHVLWTNLDDQRAVKKAVLDLANPIDRDASELYDRILVLETTLSELIKTSKDDDKSMAKGAIEVHAKLAKAKKEVEKLEAKAVEAGRKSVYLPQAKDKIRQIAMSLMQDHFKLNSQ
jgi:MoxR-like ATPase